MSISESNRDAVFLDSGSNISLNQNEANCEPFRVLSIDGGGVRGLYAATVLETLASMYTRERGLKSLDVGAGFDLIAGTSTGGIVACGLAAGIAPGDIGTFYRKHGQEIFRNPTPTSLVPFLFWVLKNLRSPANSCSPLRTALEGILGNETLAEVYDRRGIGICVPAVNMETQSPRVFKTPHNGVHKQRDNNWSMVDVCLATSAAPIILPIAEVSDPDGHGSFAFADGGLWANNPLLIGLLEALAIAEPERPIEVFSLGTCSPASGYTLGKSAGWGIWEWRAGVGISDTALNVAAKGTTHMIDYLKPHINREISVVRFPESAPSQDQARQIGLDVATPEAIRVLEVLAKHDASTAHSLAQNCTSGDFWRIARLFDNMQEFANSLQNPATEGNDHV